MKNGTIEVLHRVRRPIRILRARTTFSLAGHARPSRRVTKQHHDPVSESRLIASRDAVRTIRRPVSDVTSGRPNRREAGDCSFQDDNPGRLVT